MGAGRLAVCFGSGAHKLPASALGIRLASAMGDHLSVGSASLDLEVAVGIGSANTCIEPAELATEAIAAARAELVRIRARAAAGAMPSTGVVVSHARTGPGALGIALRNVVTRGIGQADTALQPEHPSPGVREAVASDLRLLVVGPGPSPTGRPHPTVEGLIAVARRVGVLPSVAAASDARDVLGHYEHSRAEVVVLALACASGAPNRRQGRDLATPWEQWAHTTRELVRSGATVLALGASVAAIATCVREGAIGILDLGEFAVQLEKINANLVMRRLARENGRAERRNPTNPGLPRPYDGLIDLTASEHRVLYQMMRGASATEIAEYLSVSLATIRSHIRSILRKLHVSSQLAAVALANGVHPDILEAL